MIEWLKNRRQRRPSAQKLILKSGQSPGDIVMLTAAVRELHAAYPGRYLTDVRTSAAALWDHNPLLTELSFDDPEVRVIDMHYPLIHRSNTAPYHFIHGYVQYLEEQLNLRIPLTEFRGDLYLSDHERNDTSLLTRHGIEQPYWIVVAGGKFDFTAKWWDPTSYQAVVDHFRGELQFVQCGEEGHWHKPLDGVVDMLGKTDLRELIQLIYRADGVFCPVTLAMHLAAAVETPPGAPLNRACVVVAGGREPMHWEAYPHHQYLHTGGALDCCDNGGCWKSRCQLVGDGDPKDENDLCLRPIQITDELRIPECMHMITPDDCIRRIELYRQSNVQGLTPPAEAPAIDHV